MTIDPKRRAARGQAKHPHSLHALLLLGIVLLICTALTYLIPAGQYERITDEATGIEHIVPDSFTFIERSPTTFKGIFDSLTSGLYRGAEIIFYLMIVGGMFGIVNATGALNIAIANLLKLLRGKEWLLIPVLMIFFGCGSAFCANYEEYLVFVPLILACCITAGYDSLTAVGIIFISATAGYAGGMTNAFTVGRAQQIAGLPLYSGMRFRTEIFICMMLISIAYVMWRAIAIKKNPMTSICYLEDREYNADKHLNLNRIPKMTGRHLITIVCFGAGIIYAACMVVIKHYYVDELAGVFLGTAILCGIAAGFTPNKICDSFVKGCKDIILPCLIIGLVNASIVLLDNANVLDTVLYGCAYAIEALPMSQRAYEMFVLHDLFNILVPSGSTQAAVTMPLMIPLADACGITRQTAVIAYQLGDALTNAISPTSGEVLAALAICKVPFSKWVRYLLPLFIAWFIVSLVFVGIADQMALA